MGDYSTSSRGLNNQNNIENAHVDQNNDTNKDWCGVKITDLYHNESPWNYYYTSYINPSRYHSVLYNKPVTLQNPPKPYCSSTETSHWNSNDVKMPFSSKNVFPSKENDRDVLTSRWNIIKSALSQPIMNSKQLEEAVLSYNRRRTQFHALHYFFREVVDEDEEKYFFTTLLPKIIELALELPNLIKAPLPLLKQGKPHAISISQQQIASLLANAFLCTFPWKKEYATYPGINFNSLFECILTDTDSNMIGKLKCIFHYFRRVCNKPPVGVVTFERKHLPKTMLPRWDKLNINIANLKLHITSCGTIEDDGKGMLQVDFANKLVGGGVLHWGCVQEEIRFVICPELLISKLFTEELGPNEALLITGAECFSRYTGYAGTFEWSGNCNDDTPFDECGRRKTSIVAIDATYFARTTSIQFSPSKIIRELNKAYVGFYERVPSDSASKILAPVATGNWGCGAFNGDLHLKALIQIIACAAAQRHLIYYTFSDKKLQCDIFNIYNCLVVNQITVAQLWDFMMKFNSSKLPAHQLLPFIKQSILDNLNNVSNKVKITSPHHASKNSQNIPSTSKNAPSQTERSKVLMEIENIFSDDEEEEVEVIQTSQADLDIPSTVKKIKNELDKTKTIKNILYSSDEDSSTEKSGGFLSALDYFDTKYNKDKLLDNNITDDDSDELMEICVVKNEEKTCENPTDNNSAQSHNNLVNKSRKSKLITDYFSTKS